MLRLLCRIIINYLTNSEIYSFGFMGDTNVKHVPHNRLYTYFFSAKSTYLEVANVLARVLHTWGYIALASAPCIFLALIKAKSC
jgi:hypothetical protein